VYRIISEESKIVSGPTGKLVCYVGYQKVTRVKTSILEAYARDPNLNNFKTNL